MTTFPNFGDKARVVGIVGLGYVGLPLALTFGRAGFRVLGLDIDRRKVDALNSGQSYIRHIAAADVEELVRTNRFEATGDFARVKGCDALIVCVPTPLTPAREPDMTFITGTSESLAPYVRAGQLYVLESTTYPGTTDEVVRPILERGGLKAGADFLLAFSPEREDPGNPKFNTKSIPKVVGADDPASRQAAQELYGAALDSVVTVSSTRAAELTKLLENIFRSVNIALVNELKILCERMGIDVWEVIDAAATKPFGFMPFYPGPGLGGHCIPIDPFYLTWKAREFELQTRFIELAGEINTGMPHHVIARTMDALNDRGRALKGSRVLVLGLAYKRDVDDVRESPSLRIIELLEEKGALVSYHDPLIPKTKETRKHTLEMTSVPLTRETLAAQDAVVIVTDHTSVDYELVVDAAPLVVDTRNATRKVTKGREKIVHA